MMTQFWKKKLPSLLLAILMITALVPAAGAVRADVTYQVNSGKKVTFDRADFSALKSFDYLVFTDYSSLDSYGYFTAYNGDNDQVTLKKKDLNNLWFYYDEDDIAYDGDCDLDTLTFVSSGNKSGTLTLGFELWKNSSKKYTGTLEITVGSGSSSTSAGVTYQVNSGKKVTFDRADFSALKSFDYLVFTDYSSLDSYGYFTAYNGDNDQVTLKKKDLNNLWFYYDEDDIAYDGDCDLDTLTFVSSGSKSGTLSLSFELWKNSSKKYTGTLEITVGSGSASSKTNGDIVYTLDENDDVTFDKADFKTFFQKSYTGELSYIRFTGISNLDECGVLTTYTYDSRNREWDDVELDEDDALDGYFYYDDDDVTGTSGDYCLDGLGFASDRRTDGEVVTLDFTAYGTTSSKKVTGTLVLEIGDVKNGSSAKADLEYTAAPKEELVLDAKDFNDFFQESYSRYDFKYLYFTDSENLGTYNGSMYCNYGRSSQLRLSAGNLENYYFYYDEDDIPDPADHCYALEDLSFVASEYFDTAVTLDFTAYYSSSRQVSGTVRISPKTGTDTAQTSTASASLLYTTTTGTNVQLKANDFSRFFSSRVSGSTLQSVTLLGVSAVGGLYYNYYGQSPYGTAARLQLTAANCGTQALYPSPASTAQYALTELTYVPSGSNYCASIPFAAKGTGGYTVYGSVMISVTSKAIPEVYGPAPKNTAVSFPAPAISSAVSTGTGSTLASLQLLSLPASAVGTVYVGTGTTRTADTSELYSVSGTGWTVSQLRFVPATGYTGNVELPYLAYDASGSAIGVGKLSLGFVNEQVKFSDVTSSTWCYKYVAELSDAKVISGYSNGTFKPDSTISYGAALKLIMRAAGYPELAPTVSGSTFSGYLDRARADGLITRSSVNLSAPITRLQVAQLAAGALKLDLTDLSSVQPFTDTTDKHVQALNAAGIVEGYFSNGVSTFKPNNTLTRGQVSAIVWRMQNYQ